MLLILLHWIFDRPHSQGAIRGAMAGADGTDEVPVGVAFGS